MQINNSIKSHKVDRTPKKNNTLLLLAFLLFCPNWISIRAQEDYVKSHIDSLALEKIIVEKYYVSTSQDYADTSANALPKGAVTYRIFVDLLPEYKLQMVYGDTTHTLFIASSAPIFNNMEAYAYTGFNVDGVRINQGTIALDSWITLGAASRLHTGILKSEDTDGSVLSRKTLDISDGLTKGVMPNFKVFNLDLDFFNSNKNATRFSTNNGAWAAFGGIEGPTAENRILIAQITTSGKLTFELNLQVGTPSGGYIKFVAKNPSDGEIQFGGLTYN
jgi:hypothetical protein